MVNETVWEDKPDTFQQDRHVSLLYGHSASCSSFALSSQHFMLQDSFP